MAHINYVDGAFLQIHHFIKRTFRYYFRCQAYNKNIGVKQGDVKRGVLHSLFWSSTFFGFVCELYCFYYLDNVFTSNIFHCHHGRWQFSSV